jgi:hypothetical protein
MIDHLRDGLRRVPLPDVLPFRQGTLYATVSTGQPLDTLLNEVYEGGGVLLELDEDEWPVAAYRRPEEGRADAR